VSFDRGDGRSGSGVAVPATSAECLLRPPLRALFGTAANRGSGPLPDSCIAAKQYFYSMTSSARSGNAGGMFNPSAFAVLRLTTSSNLVGAWTGRSPGFSPRKIRST
jgi:hypothetical protein